MPKHPYRIWNHILFKFASILVSASVALGFTQAFAVPSPNKATQLGGLDQKSENYTKVATPTTCVAGVRG